MFLCSHYPFTLASTSRLAVLVSNLIWLWNGSRILDTFAFPLTAMLALTPNSSPCLPPYPFPMACFKQLKLVVDVLLVGSLPVVVVAVKGLIISRSARTRFPPSPLCSSCWLVHLFRHSTSSLSQVLQLCLCVCLCAWAATIFANIFTSPGFEFSATARERRHHLKSNKLKCDVLILLLLLLVALTCWRCMPRDPLFRDFS